MFVGKKMSPEYNMLLEIFQLLAHVFNGVRFDKRDGEYQEWYENGQLKIY